jgi:RNA polymerase subunit RPABC4/transcription elongation factor Spt4
MKIMNEFTCDECGEMTESEKDDQVLCSTCGGDTQQSCPMCGSIIDSDTKVCPRCREAVA